MNVQFLIPAGDTGNPTIASEVLGRFRHLLGPCDGCDRNLLDAVRLLYGKDTSWLMQNICQVVDLIPLHDHPVPDYAVEDYLKATLLDIATCLDQERVRRES